MDNPSQENDGTWVVKSGVTAEHITVVDGDPNVRDDEDRLLVTYDDGRLRIFPYAGLKEVSFVPKEKTDE